MVQYSTFVRSAEPNLTTEARLITKTFYWVDPDAVVQREQAPHRSCNDFMQYFGQWDSFRLLIGVAYS
jgi:hypothetical protein